MLQRFVHGIVLAALLAIASVGLRAQPHAAAQDVDDPLGMLDGIGTAYSRKYIADAEFGVDTPQSTADTPSVLTVTVLEFADEDQAAAAFAGAPTGMTARLIVGGHVGDMAASPVDDLGDEATP